MAYNKKVMEHFINPRNVGETANADGEGKASNAMDGDIVVLGITVVGNKIVDVKQQVFGCAAAIAGSSAFSEMILGKEIEEALKISKEDVAEYLGGMPEGKIKCSILGPEALVKAVEVYRGRDRKTDLAPRSANKESPPIVITATEAEMASEPTNAPGVIETTQAFRLQRKAIKEILLSAPDGVTEAELMKRAELKGIIRDDFQRTLKSLLNGGHAYVDGQTGRIRFVRNE